jgi:hypothetical protein
MVMHKTTNFLMGASLFLLMGCGAGFKLGGDNPATTDSIKIKVGTLYSTVKVDQISTIRIYMPATTPSEMPIDRDIEKAKHPAVCAALGLANPVETSAGGNITGTVTIDFKNGAYAPKTFKIFEGTKLREGSDVVYTPTTAITRDWVSAQ